MPTAEKPLDDIIWLVVCSGFVFLMQAGFMCLESGLTRAKNSINVATKNISDLGLSVFCFWLWGFALMFGSSWAGWIGGSGFFVPLDHDSAWLPAFFLFQAMFCGTATTIFSGAVAERMKFAGYLVVAVILSSVLYPLFGHWAWGGLYVTTQNGWLAELGFVDFAGSTVVHGLGGWAALATVLVIGPRIGRFGTDGKARVIPGSNLPVAILGTLLLWFGWFGFNGGSTLQMNSGVPSILAHTMLAGVAGLVSTMLLGWAIDKRTDVPVLMNGSLAGLVAITAGCHAVSAQETVLIGMVGGAIMLAADRLLLRCGIDDVVGAFPVHGAAGMWGTLAVGIFGDPALLGTGLSQTGQIGVQVLGIVVCFLWTFGGLYLILTVLNRFYPLRVTPEVEEMGLNIAEHGATTELIDLFLAMERQAQSGSLSMRVPVEPFTEVGQIAQRYNLVMSSLEQASHDLKHAYERMAKELKAASQVQQSLLPQHLPKIDGASFAWHYRPCEELAGDILNIIPLDEDHVAIYVADVSGHGVAAALLSVAVSRSLIPHAENGSILVEVDQASQSSRIVSPKEVARELNRRFPMEDFSDKYFTIIYGILDLKTREFRFTSAGHPPVIHDGNGSGIQMIDAEGIPIGWTTGGDFYEERSLILKPGDRLYLFSDGISEAMSPKLEPFGDDRLLETIAEVRSHPIDIALQRLLHRIETWCHPAEPRDDISVLSVEVA